MLSTANMDKTPIPYSPKHKTTIAKKGLKSIKAKKLDCKIKVTSALTVSQTGEKIKPFVIFVGKCTSRAKHFNKMKNDHNKYPQTDVFCTCSPKGGMKLTVMKEWINNIWCPFTNTCNGPAT